MTNRFPSGAAPTLASLTAILLATTALAQTSSPEPVELPSMTVFGASSPSLTVPLTPGATRLRDTLARSDDDALRELHRMFPLLLDEHETAALRWARAVTAAAARGLIRQTSPGTARRPSASA